MRRKDREVTRREEILEIMRDCDVCNLSLMDGEYPYTVPLNFGILEDENGLWLVFHTASAGKKLDLLRGNPHAAFAMSARRRLEIENGCHCTMRYASVCGRGLVRELADEEKKPAMDALIGQYRPGVVYEGDAQSLSGVTMLALEVEQIAGKNNPPRE